MKITSQPSRSASDLCVVEHRCWCGGVVAGGRSLARWVVVVLVAVIGLFLVAGCGSSQGGGSNSLGAKALQNLSQFDKRVLKDKHVTQTEYDESKQVYKECLTAAGLKYQVQDGAVVVSGPVPSSQDGSDSDDPMERCVNKVNAVQEVWVLEHHASASELASLRAKLISCLRRAGLHIKHGATMADIVRARMQFLNSLPAHFSNNSPEGVIANRAAECQQSYQNAAGGQPLPGLKEALKKLNTSGW